LHKYLRGSKKGSYFAPFFDGVCSQGALNKRDAYALARTKNGIRLFKRKEQK